MKKWNCPIFHPFGARQKYGRLQPDKMCIRDSSIASATIIPAATMVAEAMEAAELLAADGISARVVDMFTIKPIDEDLLTTCAQETGAIVTAENHNIIGGLGSAVCETLGSNCPVPVERVRCV